MLHMTRRVALLLGLTVAAAPFAAMPSAEAAYPDRPVTIVVAWTAGGATDLLTRGIQDAFQKALGTQVVVKNVPGAAGTLGCSRTG